MTESQENPLSRMEVKPGDLVGGRYEIVRLLGAGGMGAVYEARHKVINRVVAIKVLHPQIAMHPQYAGRFLQEAKAAAELSHKHIVQLTDYGLDGERPYMVMEYLHGESFGATLKREGRLPIERVVAVMDPVLRALAFAHDRGVIHRDIKPDNIFLAKDDEGEVTPKIVDFGIAKRQDESVQLTTAGAALGTPAYMAPEQIMASKSVTPAADQYAVGVTMYEALTGENPYTAETLNAFIVAKATQDPRPITEHRPDLDPVFAAIVMRTLARNPEDRFPSVSALREALAPWRGATLSGVAGFTSAPPPGVPTAPQIRRDEALARTATPLPPALTTLPNGTPDPRVPGAPILPSSTPVTPTVIEVPAARDSRPMVIAVGAVALVAVAAIFAVVSTRTPAPQGHTTTAPTPPPPAERVATRVVFSVQATPATATILIDGEVVGTGRAEVVRPKDNERHQLEIRAEGYVPMTEVLVADGDVRVSRALVARPAAQATNAAHGAPRGAQTAQPRATEDVPRAAQAPAPQVVAQQPTAQPQPVAQPERPATPDRPAQPNHAHIDTTNPF